MNVVLTETIIRHIFASFLMIPSNHIDSNKNKSLMSKEYLLKEKLKIELDDGTVVKNHVYGCKMSAGEQEIIVLAGNCTQDPEVPELCLMVQLKNAPLYGLYLVYNDMDDQVTSDPMLACSLDGKSWMPCNTFLQATFLAGMEQLKDTGVGWTNCTDYKDQYDGMMSFLDFHINFYEVADAWQKN